MKLYRFSPITSKEQLLEAIEYTHFACLKMCKQTIGDYLPIAGNFGIFCHYGHEFEQLIKLRDKLTDPSNPWNKKYFRLVEPIIVEAKDGIPGGTYTYLYVRQPDPYRSQVGDTDFILKPKGYTTLKESLKDTKISGLRSFDRSDVDMLELFDPDIDALGYIRTKGSVI